MIIIYEIGTLIIYKNIRHKFFHPIFKLSPFTKWISLLN